jgi:hypothetical protein
MSSERKFKPNQDGTPKRNAGFSSSGSGEDRKDFSTSSSSGDQQPWVKGSAGVGKDKDFDDWSTSNQDKGRGDALADHKRRFGFGKDRGVVGGARPDACGYDEGHDTKASGIVGRRLGSRSGR